MPRRGNDFPQLQGPPRKKLKASESPPPSLDASFFDDEALPPGIVFSDVQQKKWRIGKPIGRGSFGRIYLASDDVDKEVTKATARYVVKIEPHTNGPLFVEVHCLVRTAQVKKVKRWRQENKQKRVGMPVYIASGSFTDENTGVKYRFLVLPRYDIDLQKIIARTKVLDLKNVLVLAIQILEVLEYLHNEGYTHSDIKSSNLMLGFNGANLNKNSLIRPTPSFQKETKELAVLSGKHRRAKSGKGRTSNYYDDEDFIVKEFKIIDNTEEEDRDNRLANVKKKLRKILSDRDSRTLHRHHAFNLRQLSNCVNYEDLNSSVCSDQSYQKLIDDVGSKIREEFYNDDKSNHNNLDVIYKEAIRSQSNGQIYLIDYGLASKFLDSEGNHRDFGMDARKAHDGTLEYSSRDSHIGAHSRRSDLETLGYNLLDWLTGSLPWKTTEVLQEPDLVHALKKNFMGDIKTLLKTCFKTEFYPQFMERYLEYVTSLDFTEKPDYEFCRSLFKSELLKHGYDKDMALNFADAPMSPMNRKLCYVKRFGKKNTPPDFVARNGIKKSYERENVFSLENDLKLELLKQTLNSSSDGIRKPCTSRNFFISDADLVARLKKSLMPHDVFGKKLSPKNLRSNKKNVNKRRGVRKHRNSIGKFGNFMGSARQFTWAEILAGNPEDIIRKERNANNDETDDDETECKYRIRKLSNASDNTDSNQQSPLLQKDYLLSLKPTYAMKEVFDNFSKKVSTKNLKESTVDCNGLDGYTPAMIKVYKMKAKREAKEKMVALKQQVLQRNDVPETKQSTRTTRSKANGNAKRIIESRQKTISTSSLDKTDSCEDKSRNTAIKKSTRSKVDGEKEITIKNNRKSLRLKEKSIEQIKVGLEMKQADCSISPDEHKSGNERKSTSRTLRNKQNLNDKNKTKDEVKTKMTGKKTSIVCCNTKNKSKPDSSKAVEKGVNIVLSKRTNRSEKSPPRTRKSAPIPNNRRILRSSKRK